MDPYLHPLRNGPAAVALGAAAVALDADHFLRLSRRCPGHRSRRGLEVRDQALQLPVGARGQGRLDPLVELVNAETPITRRHPQQFNDPVPVLVRGTQVVPGVHVRARTSGCASRRASGTTFPVRASGTTFPVRASGTTFPGALRHDISGARLRHDISGARAPARHFRCAPPAHISGGASGTTSDGRSGGVALPGAEREASSAIGKPYEPGALRRTLRDAAPGDGEGRVAAPWISDDHPNH